MILVLLGTQNNSFYRLLEEVQKCIDEDIINEKLITFHPNDNTATIFITLQDMFKILNDLDYSYEIIKL